MRTLSALVAVGSLFGAVVFIPLVGGALIAMILFGLFLLARVGVIGSLEDHTVRPARSVDGPEGVAQRLMSP